MIQRVCRGRQVNHIAAGVDAVSYAALDDAVTHPGAASVKRLSRSVCSQPFAPDLDDQQTRESISRLYGLAASRTFAGTDGARLLTAEPAVRAYALGRSRVP